MSLFEIECNQIKATNRAEMIAPNRISQNKMVAEFSVDKVEVPSFEPFTNFVFKLSSTILNPYQQHEQRGTNEGRLLQL